MAAVDQVEAIIERLRGRGGRGTSARRATIQVLLDTGHAHLSAEEIATRVKASQPEVAESTVYRTLNALETLGVVEHVHLGHGPSTYHLSADTHQHLLCDSCGAVVEVPDEVFAALSDQLQETYGFRIHPHHFAMVGECRVCQTGTRDDRSGPSRRPSQ